MHLSEPPASEERAAAYQEDIDEDGFVWTITKLWSWNPDATELFSGLLARVAEDGGLAFRDRGFIVSSTASAISNSGCALAWGNRLSTATDVETAAQVIRGGETATMSDRDRALTRWSRKVAADPSSITPVDVAALRAIGMSDAEIFNLTLYVALRVAFSTVNDALDAPLDRELTDRLPRGVVEAVDFGRPPA